MIKKILFSLLALPFLFNDWYYIDGGYPPDEAIPVMAEYDGYCKGNENHIYLTFDEGYENGNTNHILDVLKENEVPAAFFVVGPYISKEPELVKRMVNEGHIVGNHTEHQPDVTTFNEQQIKEELEPVEKKFKETTGSDMPKFFRPPMGKYSENSMKATKNLGYNTIFWNFAYKDWLINEQPDKQRAFEHIVNNTKPGSILLLHAVSDTNSDILDSVIKELKNKGYDFASLNEL